MRIPDTTDLILFDLDGLLVDTEHLHWQAYQHMCQEYGQILPWDFPDYLKISGGSSTGVREQLEAKIPELFQGRDWDELYNVKRQKLYEILSSTPIPLMKGVEHCLPLLAGSGRPLSVVTHSPQRFVEMVKAAHPVFALITRWIWREMYKAPKPAPDGYVRACAELNISPARAIGFEDSVRGVEALIAAHIPAVLVNGVDPSARFACAHKKVRMISSLQEIEV
jgi:HAD superfamily hydrolase (TIGR01509 family)